MVDEKKEKKTLRSIIKKYFPVELLIQLDEITIQRSLNNNKKTPEILALLDKYKVPYTPLGNGTNRYGIQVDGYAIKIALDRMGKIDNQREFKYSKTLYPYVVKVYECTTNGLIASFEYVTIFSLDDYYDHQDDMRSILDKITPNFLVGDIGVSQKNYINWGIRGDGSICILDFAYIYSLSYRGFLCSCEDEGNLQPDQDSNYYVCPFCKKKYSFADIRRRITKQDEANEIGDISTLGYVLHNPEEEVEVDITKTPHKAKKEKPRKLSVKEKILLNSSKQDYDLDVNAQAKSLMEFDKLIKGGNKNE